MQFCKEKNNTYYVLPYVASTAFKFQERKNDQKTVLSD